MIASQYEVKGCLFESPLSLVEVFAPLQGIPELSDDQNDAGFFLTRQRLTPSRRT
jgi:hypothetical protein